ncbi:MAG: hypothetical protein HYX47_21425 [Burkholderiales bacterium]|nr:hypothetical protein [Burkholderiales bacterium]
MFERISGPFGHWYVAVYVEPCSGCDIVGYYKICPSRPESYFESACLYKGCSPTREHSVQDALQSAEAAAFQVIRRLEHGHFLIAGATASPAF